MPRLNALPATDRLDAEVSFFCAAGAAGDLTQMRVARERLLGLGLLTPAAVERLEAFFLLPPVQQRAEFLLPQLQPFGLDLSYALWERYIR